MTSLTVLLMSAGAMTGLLVGGIILLRSRFLFVTVRGMSMAPTLHPRDHVLVWRVRAGKGITTGAIVLLDASAAHHHPAAPGPFIKRVVAVAGETYTDLGTSGLKTRRWVIPAGMIFVCGDHRTASEDSRAWGPVPLGVITGVVMHHFQRQTSLRGRRA